VTDYLLSDEFTTRYNTSVTLGAICNKFSAELSSMLINSKSDGSLLTFADVDVKKVIERHGEEYCLLGGDRVYSKVDTDDMHDLSGSSSKLYKKAWLKSQRRALRKRLGLESNVDIGMEMDSIGVESMGNTGVLYDKSSQLLEDVDVQIKGLSSTVSSSRIKRAVLAGRDSSQSSCANKGDEKVPDKEDGNMDSFTSETWFARLMRFLAVSLLDQHWQVRHGSHTIVIDDPRCKSNEGHYISIECPYLFELFLLIEYHH
jgi:hypothetical protein